MIHKKVLAYSTLTDKVYWVDGNGKQTDVTQNFIQVMLLFLSTGQKPEKGMTHERHLMNKGETYWILTMTRVAGNLIEEVE